MESWTESLIKKLGQDNFQKVQQTAIGIAGAGGLGSNCALNLCRVGFKKLVLVDFDTVSSANLDRQFYFADQVGQDKVSALKDNLSRVNPGLEIVCHKQRISQVNARELFCDCAIIAECLDSAESKSMLVAQLLPCVKLIVAVSGLGGWGNSDSIKTHKIKDNLIIIGDLESDISARPALSPRVNIAAAKQADIILEFIIKSC